MEVPIRRIDKSLPLPEYKTAGAAAMDCAVRDEVTVPPRTTIYAPLNFAIKPPQGHFVLLAARSSLHKRGIVMANSVAIGDEDFAGDNDEYCAALYNMTDTPVTLARGDRVLQMIILPFDRVEWKEVETLGQPDRGGFGTTGI